MPQQKSSAKPPAAPTTHQRDHNSPSSRALPFGLAAVATPLFGFLFALKFHTLPNLGIYIREAFERVMKMKMRSILLTAFCFSASCIAQLASVDTFLATQVPISKAGLLANIGPNGAKASGAKAGVVIASPSTSDPDYLYTWTRDAALVLKTIIQEYTTGQDVGLRTVIDDYVSSQALLQQVSNPSGTIDSGGLGEPKFHINLTAFTGPWGRPQRDGPALRATALIQYANWLIASGETSYASNKLWPVVKLDLDYVATYWNQSGFDLWEEVSSSSFFTTASQLRALREGAALATKLGQTSSATNYGNQLPNVYCFLQSYWNPTGGYITSNTGGGRSGKDANSVIASIHNFDAASGCDASTFQPCSDKALANHKAYVDSFRSIYKINDEFGPNAAVATGRYSEDIYYDGNPWYLTTFATAEQLYDALTVWKSFGAINVTSTSLPFFQQLSPSITTGTYTSSSPVYASLTSAIRNYADGFIAVAAKYIPSNGALAEQYNRENGVPLSAKDLTWSYAALLTASAARNGFAQQSWGASELVMPTECSGASIPNVAVTFKVDATTTFGENIYIAGSIDALGNWAPVDAPLLSSEDYPTWSLTVDIPANTRFEYKYIRKNNGTVSWESGPNRSFTTAASGSQTVVDTWR